MQQQLKISIFIIIAFSASFFSCKNKKICAAYNSYFVFNETNIAPFFAPFGSDSTPGEKKANLFNTFGLINKNGKRDDSKLLVYKYSDFKKGELKLADSSVMANRQDSTGSIIKVEQLFPERANTDQAAYEHYMKQLAIKYKTNSSNPKSEKRDKQEFDSLIYYNNPPENLTKEEKKQWKKDKKAYKKRKKEREKRDKENARKEEEENLQNNDDDEFDFDFDE